MKGDFSRLMYEPTGQTTGIWLQQGRVSLDSDWNLQVALNRSRLSQSLTDLIGPAGAPANWAGFEIIPRLSLILNKYPDQSQCLALAHSRSLPFRCADLECNTDLEICEIEFTSQRSVHMVAWEDFELQCERHRERDLPYTVLLKVNIADGASGPLLCRPGHFSLEIGKDRTVHFIHAESPGVHTTQNEIVLPLGETDLWLVHSGRYYLLYAGHQLLGRWKANGATSHRLERHEPALMICGRSSDHSSHTPNYLRAAIGGFRLWRRAYDVERLHQHLRHTKLSNHSFLVCDLNLSGLHDGVIPDSSGHENEAEAIFKAAPPDLEIRQIDIGDGRYYLEGVAVENPSICSIAAQPYLPEFTIPLPLPKQQSLFYLDVWERFLTSLERPSQLDPALGGADTTAHTELVWQVRMLSANTEHELHLQWRRLAGPRLGRLAFYRGEDESSALGNNLYRVEIRHSGWVLGSDVTQSAWDECIEATVKSAHEAILSCSLPSTGLPIAGSPVLLFADDPHLGVLATVTKVTDNDVFFVSQLPDGFSTGDLVRILPIASFTWSRDNGSIAFPVRLAQSVESMDGELSTEFLLSSPGFNGLQVGPGDWVELVNDENQLLHKPGPLLQVSSVDRVQLRIVVKGGLEPGHHSFDHHPILRRWDNGYDEGAQMTAASSPWLPLERGIAVQFSAGRYETGDYWACASRNSVSEPLIWPEENGSPAFLPAHGIHRRFTALAKAHTQDHHLHIHDLRVFFDPLITTDIAPQWEAPEIEKPVSPRWHPSLRMLVEGDEIPDGFRPTGETILARHAAKAKWRDAHDLPPLSFGPTRTVIQGDDIVALPEGRDYLWRLPKGGQTWIKTDTMPHRLTGFAYAQTGERLIVAGGRILETSHLSDRIEALGKNGHWEQLGRLHHPLHEAGAAVIGNRLFIAGGFDRKGQLQSAMWAFDFELGKVQPCAPMPTARACFVLIAHGERLLALGGMAENKTPLAAVESYDPWTDRWTALDPLPYPNHNFAAAAILEGIVVAGGMTYSPNAEESPENQVSLYSADGSGWTQLSSMPLQRYRFGLVVDTVFGAKRLLALGGLGPNSLPVAEISALPLTSTLHVITPMDKV